MEGANLEARSGRASRGPRPAMVLTATILASSLSFIDSSVVNVALPALRATFGGDAAGLQWVIDGYLLPLSALVLLGGALGDQFGRRRVLLLGIVLFAASSAGCAAATSFGALVATRMAQGVAAALLMPNSLAVLGQSFDERTRARAVGIWASVGAAMSGLGPPFGGWLIDAAGWRAVFMINLPVAAAAAWLAWVSIPPDRGGRDRPLDFGGAALAILGLGALTYGLVRGSGPEGWTAETAGIVVLGLMAAVTFVLWEGRRGDRAMMPLALFGSRAFVGLTILTLSLYGALGALVVLLPYGLMRVGGASAEMAGLALLPLTAAIGLLSPVLGGLAGRFGSRPFLAGGPALVAVGFLLLLRANAGSDYWTSVLPAELVIGTGLAGAVAPLTTAVLGSVERHLTGTASGFNSAVARTGGLVATASLGRVLAATGEGFIASAHVAALIAAAASSVAAASALLLPRSVRRSADGTDRVT